MNIKTYYTQKQLAMDEAKKKLDAMNDTQRFKLAVKLKLSLATLHSYRFGNGNNFETALLIIGR
jgi:hypothetical protein